MRRLLPWWLAGAMLAIGCPSSSTGGDADPGWQTSEPLEPTAGSAATDHDLAFGPTGLAMRVLVRGHRAYYQTFGP